MVPQGSGIDKLCYKITTKPGIVSVVLGLSIILYFGLLSSFQTSSSMGRLTAATCSPLPVMPAVSLPGLS